MLQTMLTGDHAGCSVVRQVCRHPIEVDLAPEQVLQLEDFAKKLRTRTASSDVLQEGEALRNMRRRVALLEERLAKALAFGDLPKHMQGACKLGSFENEWTLWACSLERALSMTQSDCRRARDRRREERA